jgi:Family of unknown function (DUF5330)
VESPPGRLNAKIFDTFEEKPSHSQNGLFAGCRYGPAIKPAIDRTDDKPERQATGRGTTTMWFMIKGAFWFSLVLVMLPIFDHDATERLANEKGIELTDALGAAAGVISYAGELCTQKPDVCVKGAETLSTLSTRAREGALVAYTYLDSTSEDKGKAPATSADAVTTGSLPAAERLVRIPIPQPRPHRS